MGETPNDAVMRVLTQNPALRRHSEERKNRAGRPPSSEDVQRFGRRVQDAQTGDQNVQWLLVTVAPVLDEVLREVRNNHETRRSI